MSEQSLRDAGWRQTASGRWFHHDVPDVAGQGRRRTFTTDDALAMLAAWDSPVFEAVLTSGEDEL